MNLVNPIPAYLMAILYHGVIRPGQLAVSTGAEFFIEYVQLMLPSWNDCIDLLSWVVTGRASLIWNYWDSIGRYITHMAIYPISIAGVIIDPLQVVVWFHWSIFDHGLVRPGLFLGTIVATRIGRTLGIYV